MSIINTIQFIVNHPLNRSRKISALIGFLKWQIGSRLVPGKVVFEWINGAKIIVQSGETGLTGNIYCGLHELPDMAYVLHVVTAEDLFVDIGANVGSYTILACAAKGAKGYCFEPVPATFSRLLDNIHINNLGGRVIALNIGLSDKESELVFSADKNCMNHVIADGEQSDDVVKVRVSRLDTILKGKSPSILKIDVEGFEASVLNGAEDVLGNPSLHSVVMELAEGGAKYGFKDDDILNKMKKFGFSTYSYDPFGRKLISLEGKKNQSGNTLFIRNRDLVEERIAMAPKLFVGSVQI